MGRKTAAISHREEYLPAGTAREQKGTDCKKNIIVGLGYCKTQPEWAKAKFGKEAFHFKPHNVEPSLAVTPWKSQGRAYERAVFDSSNAFGATQMSLELLYVAFTRVTNLRSIRMLPSKKMEKFRQALLILRPDFLATRFRCRAERKAIARRLREAATSLDVTMTTGASNERSGNVDCTRSGSVTRARNKAAAAPTGMLDQKSIKISICREDKVSLLEHRNYVLSAG